MAGLQIRELPEGLYRKLAEDAQHEHRSMAQQAVATLARGLAMHDNPKLRRRQLLAGIRSRAPQKSKKDWPDPVFLVHQDRER